MEDLKKIGENFLSNLSDSFSKTKSKKIMSRTMASLLAITISGGALAQSQSYGADITSNQMEAQTVSQTIKSDNQHEYGRSKDIKIKAEDLKSYEKPGEQSGLVVEHPEYLYDLTIDNYKEIIDNGISGVYKHPYLEGEIVTFIFDNDKRENPYAEVQHQLTKLGVDIQGFGSEYREISQRHFIEKKFLGKVPHSSHSQFIHDHYDDTNYSKINVGKHETESEYMAMLATLNHEAAHSFKHQQQSKTLIPNQVHKELVRAEISSNIGGNLKTFQQAFQMGKVEVFKEVYSETSMFASMIMANKGTWDAHLYVSSDKVLNDLFENQPDLVNKFTNGDIVNLSEVISSKALDFNYYDEYKVSVNKEADSIYKIMKEIDKELRKDPEHVQKVFEKLSNSDIDFENPKGNSEEKVVLYLKAFERYKDGDYYLSKEDFKENYVEEISDNVLGEDKELKITDRGLKHLILNFSQERFLSEIKATDVYKNAGVSNNNENNLENGTFSLEAELSKSTNNILDKFEMNNNEPSNDSAKINYSAKLK